MKKIIFFIFILMVIVLNAACGRQSEIRPIKTETLSFDLDDAVEMLLVLDEPLADISIKDSVSRDEFNEFVASIQRLYHSDYKFYAMFFSNEEYEDDTVKELHIKKDVFYPTILHMDIEVTEANIFNSFYEDSSFDTSFLTIVMSYTGNDKNLFGWSKEFIFKKDENNWEFYSFGGTLNFSGGEFTSSYLPLK